MKNKFQLLFLFAFLIGADQYSKFLFSANSICNKNISWGVPLAPGFFYIFWLIIFFVLLYFFGKSRDHSEKIALTLVISGAISNMLDRTVRSCIVDFINLRIWPVFNLADIYITIGVILLLIFVVQSQNQSPNAK